MASVGHCCCCHATRKQQCTKTANAITSRWCLTVVLYQLPLPGAQTVNTCEVCGEVAHEGCARHVPHDCKPVALDAPEMVHLWRPAGVAMSAQDVSDPIPAAPSTMC